MISLRHQSNINRNTFKIILLALSIILVLEFFMLISNTFSETIKGTVSYKSPEDAGKVVVYIKKASGNFFPPKEHPKMDQIDLTFAPYVLPVIRRTTVDFHNSDDVLNNVFTPSWAGHRFNLGTYPKSVVRSFTFDRLGKVVLLCKIHPEMVGYILVLQNSYFAVPDKDGFYSIQGIPPGNYKIRMWYDKNQGLLKKITVSAGKDLVVDFR